MKTVKKIWNAISIILVSIIVLLAILLAGVRIVGLTPYSVLSGSMEPTYHVGSLIYVKDIESADIKIGDPITFVINEEFLAVTHRVVDIEILTAGEEGIDETTYYYQTKGDANEEADAAPVHHKNVVGTPVFSIPYLGYLSVWLQTRKGMIMGISIALALLILTFLPDFKVCKDH